MQPNTPSVDEHRHLVDATPAPVSQSTTGISLAMLKYEPRLFAYLMLTGAGAVTTVAGAITLKEPLNNALIGTGVGLMSSALSFLFYSVCKKGPTQGDEPTSEASQTSGLGAV